MSDDFVFRGPIYELDPGLERLLRYEDLRQVQKVILVASESAAPQAVREAMASSFGNVYAEGYPREDSRRQTESEILDVTLELAHYRRYSDPRYYKGVEYADLLEALARRRAAELFAANGITPEELYVNVQPLSGSPANSAVYSALLEPGDTILGLDLIDGGHLTHGSPVNRSGKLYRAVSYTVDPITELLDYEAIARLAQEEEPRLIIAGFTAYPCAVNWKKFREIADQCGAYLLADIAHISGLVAAGLHSSPVGVADVVSTTTHKSLCGPRGAMIMTHRPDLARLIDRTVFPGEQGGPHLNTLAALAVALKLANSDQFRALQKRIIENSQLMAKSLSEHGLRIVGGSSQNHLLLVDVKVISHDGVPLSGDMAARILDIAGIVTNRNTIPGDASAFAASGIRLGTVWISQLGFGRTEIGKLTEAIATVLNGCTPFAYSGRGGRPLLRAKVNYRALQRGRELVAQLTQSAGQSDEIDTLQVRGQAAARLLNFALTSDLTTLEDGESQPTHLFGPDLDLDATVLRLQADRFALRFSNPEAARCAVDWLEALSDGYVQFDDLYAKLPGPVAVKLARPDMNLPGADATPDAFAPCKPYFVGCHQLKSAGDSLPPFEWQQPTGTPLLRTGLHETHLELGGRMVPFAGWDMPVWYTSVSDEHSAVRNSAALFDVSHMGVLEASGPCAAEFLDLVTTNDVHALPVGRSHYTYLLQPDGSVLDDLLIYRRDGDRFMLVVNAANNDSDWAWLNAVNEGRTLIDSRRPWARVQQSAALRDLRDPQWGDECRVDIALQGPRSREILLSLCYDQQVRDRIRSLPWAGVVEGALAGFEVIVSRTGYTGERIAYELFVHPDEIVAFWNALLEAGAPYGIKPAGLAARDSTRTEAGLPLHGHELAGLLAVSPAEAGFSSYVKLWKPFFVGREAFMEDGLKSDRTIVRFRMNEKGVRRPELGDPVLDRRGKVVGTITSCAIDTDGYLLGQALVPSALSSPGTTLSIYQLGGGQRSLTVPKHIQLGTRLPSPDGATVLSRFPSHKN